VLKQQIKSLIHSAIQRSGYDIHRWRPPSVDPSIPKAFAAQKRLLNNREVSTIFDVGANRGDITAIYKSVFPNAKVFAFEPFPEMFERLKRRFAQDPTVTPIPMAVSNATETRDFYVNELIATNSLLPLAPETNRYYHREQDKTKAIIQVPAITIDDFVRQERIEKIDILKFDIQGGELMALKGAIHTLQQSLVSLIFLETMYAPVYKNVPLLHAVWNFLEQQQYTLYDLYSLCYGANGQLTHSDALFVSRPIRSEVIEQIHDQP
jgi:FkbM family methyltransferase